MISCLVLAAGESTRFPGNKLLYELKPNVSVLELLLKSVIRSKVDQTVIVLGFESNLIKKKIEYLLSSSVYTIFNEVYKEGGMSSSIRKGLEILKDNEAILITPGDIPLIPSSVINLIINIFYIDKPKIIIPTHNNFKGHPILISSKLFSEVSKITEEKQGLKEIINNNWNEIKFIPTECKGILRDLDKYEDVSKIDKSL